MIKLLALLAVVLSATLVRYVTLVGDACAAPAGAALPAGAVAPAGTVQPAEDPYAYDFGTLAAGTVIEHAFLLENRGELPLQIRDVTTSCGCTATRVDKNRLLPGDAATIEVKFDSAGYAGDTTQFVYVTTDDTDVPVVKYTIKAHVIPAPAAQAPAAK